jgi:hypothetical protein
VLSEAGARAVAVAVAVARQSRGSVRAVVERKKLWAWGMRAAAWRAVGSGTVALVEQLDVSVVEMRLWDVVVLRAEGVGGKEYGLRTFISGMQIGGRACRGL